MDETFDRIVVKESFRLDLPGFRVTLDSNGAMLETFRDGAPRGRIFYSAVADEIYIDGLVNDPPAIRLGNGPQGGGKISFDRLEEPSNPRGTRREFALVRAWIERGEHKQFVIATEVDDGEGDEAMRRRVLVTADATGERDSTVFVERFHDGLGQHNNPELPPPGTGGGGGGNPPPAGSFSLVRADNLSLDGGWWHPSGPQANVDLVKRGSGRVELLVQRVIDKPNQQPPYLYAEIDGVRVRDGEISADSWSWSGDVASDVRVWCSAQNGGTVEMRDF